MKKSKKPHSLLYILPAAALIALLLYAGVRAVAIWLPQKREQSSFEQLKQKTLPRQSVAVPAAQDGSETSAEQGEPASAQPNRFAALTEMNGDFAGWLTVEGTDIDYPVMKTADDDAEYYLRRNFDRKYSVIGTPFIGAGCDVDTVSLIIYGHNTSTGVMFGTLDRFNDVSFALAHPYITFDTPAGDRTYKVFAAFQTRLYGEDENVFRYYEAIGDLDEEAYTEAVRNLRQLSSVRLPDAPSYPTQLLMLSTCSYHTSNGRFVVAAYRVDP